jgi:hypothetical protein
VPTDSDPLAELTLADSIGPALLIVLDRLAPAERVAFVLHDMFDLSFDEIAPIVNRTPTAARQLGSSLVARGAAYMVPRSRCLPMSCCAPTISRFARPQTNGAAAHHWWPMCLRAARTPPYPHSSTVKPVRYGWRQAKFERRSCSRKRSFFSVNLGPRSDPCARVGTAE